MGLDMVMNEPKGEEHDEDCSNHLQATHIRARYSLVQKFPAIHSTKTEEYQRTSIVYQVHISIFYYISQQS